MEAFVGSCDQEGHFFVLQDLEVTGAGQQVEEVVDLEGVEEEEEQEEQEEEEEREEIVLLSDSEDEEKEAAARYQGRPVGRSQQARRFFL